MRAQARRLVEKAKLSVEVAQGLAAEAWLQSAD